MLAGFVLGVVGPYVVDLVPIPFIEPLAPRLVPDLGAFFSLWCWFTIVAVCIGLSNAFVLNVLLQLVRSQWLAVSIFVISMTIVFTAGGPLITALRGLLLLLIVVYALMRFGVLAEVALLYVHNVLGFPADDQPFYVVRTCRNVSDWQRCSARHLRLPTRTSRANTLAGLVKEPVSATCIQCTVTLASNPNSLMHSLPNHWL